MAVLWQFLCSLLLCGQPPLIYLTLLLSQCLCPSLECLSIIVATLPFLKLHISSLSWLLLCYTSNISLIIITYVLMSIFYFFFYVECGHPEEGTEFKRPLWIIFFACSSRNVLKETSQYTLKGTFCKCTSCLKVINVNNFCSHIFLFLCYFLLQN